MIPTNPPVAATPPASEEERPGRLSRLRSRQAGHPSGLLGRAIGRLMVKDTRRHNDRSLDLLALTEPMTVLEVGYGQGRTLARLLGAGHRVLGVDVSETMRRQATARNRTACRDGRAALVTGDGRTVPFDTASADAALTTHTVYFMDDPATTIAEIARVLRPGGRLVVACHLGDDPMPAWMDPTVYRIPTRAQLEKMLEDAGFAHVTGHGDGAAYPTYWFVADLPA
jgi:SAM-dependent methyltransferase